MNLNLLDDYPGYMIGTEEISFKTDNCELYYSNTLFDIYKIVLNFVYDEDASDENILGLVYGCRSILESLYGANDYFDEPECIYLRDDVFEGILEICISKFTKSENRVWENNVDDQGFSKVNFRGNT